MTAFRHTRCGWRGETDGTGREACYIRCGGVSSVYVYWTRNDYLEDVLPLEVDVRICKVDGVVSMWVHNEAILSVQKALLVPNSMNVPRPPAPPRYTAHLPVLPWWKTEIEQIVHILRRRLAIRLGRCHLGPRRLKSSDARKSSAATASRHYCVGSLLLESITDIWTLY